MKFCLFVLSLTMALAMPQRFQDFPFEDNFFFPDNINTFITTTAAPAKAAASAAAEDNFVFPDNINRITTTTAAPATTAASAAADSPQYLRCFQSCPSTMEYNPICGTDSQNYHNVGRLGCAQRCGKNVAAVRSGTCAPLG